MPRLLPALFLLAALPAQAETLSGEIGRSGLAAVEARLAALPSPTDEERFTLGGVQFLRALEISFQDRWREGLTDRTGFLPFLRLPMDENPAPQPFQPGTITAIFQKAGAELDKAKATLSAIPDTSDFGATIALDDLWLDVDSNSSRAPDESLAVLLGRTLALPAEESPAGTPPEPIQFRFDVADAAWLAAYADMLGALSALVQAYDPTEPITRILATRAGMEKMGPLQPDYIFGSGPGLQFQDVIAIVLAALDQQPDKARMLAVQAHLQAMIAENRAFWTRVATETDDDHEWLPNAQQHSALGIEVPPEAGAHWLAVLDEMEAMLQGKALLPFWRLGPPVGVNLAKVFADPRPVDIAGWLQGWAVLPYLDKGRLVSWDAVAAFDQATSGRAMLFALYFN